MAALKLTSTQWLICIIAAIGFAFDIYELLMLPLIIKPAMAALSAPLVDELVRGGMARPEAMALWLPGGEMYVKWARTLFFIPALAGGVFTAVCLMRATTCSPPSWPAKSLGRLMAIWRSGPPSRLTGPRGSGV